MIRIFQILAAEIKCNCYCMWQLIRYLNPVCELRTYGQNGDITMIATIKYSIFETVTKGQRASIDRVFYEDSNDY